MVDAQGKRYSSEDGGTLVEIDAAFLAQRGKDQANHSVKRAQAARTIWTQRVIREQYSEFQKFEVLRKGGAELRKMNDFMDEVLAFGEETAVRIENDEDVSRRTLQWPTLA